MSDTASEPTREESADADDRKVSLRLDDVTKTFEDDDGEVVAVDSVSMNIYDGEFVVLVGPSGCGKTTTLRMIAGLENPTEGRIEINGEDVLGQDPRERNVAMVFQNYALYPHKTVRENLAFPLIIRRYREEERESRVGEVSEMLGIGELLDRQPRELSGGQQQRVALGRAIIRDPELFLFDEPLSNLDAKLRIQMRTELNKLHNRVGKTSVYVTHDQEEAMTLGDRIAVMNDGRLQQIAPPQRVYETPANRFVAGFIGEPPMNFFDVELVERERTEANSEREASERTSGRGSDSWLVSDAFELALPDEMSRKLASWDGDPERLVFGVRPEDLGDAALVDEGGTERGNTFQAHVKVVEPMGSNVDLTLAPPGAPDDEASEFTARVSNETEAREGTTITLSVDVANGHVFDERTGENLTGETTARTRPTQS